MFINTGYTSDIKPLIPKRPTVTSGEAVPVLEKTMQHIKENKKLKEPLIPSPKMKEEESAKVTSATVGTAPQANEQNVPKVQRLIPTKTVEKNRYYESMPSAEEENLVNLLTKLNCFGKKLDSKGL